MRYEVETAYDIQTLQKLEKILNQTLRAGRIRATRIIAFIIGVFSICYGLLWLWAYFNVSSNELLIPALSGFLAGGLFILLALFYDKYLQRRKRKNNSQTIAYRYSFDKNGYTTEIGQKRMHSAYNIIKSLYSDDSCYVLMLNRRSGFLLNKSDFTSGNADNFREFIEKQTGKTIQYTAR